MSQRPAPRFCLDAPFPQAERERDPILEASLVAKMGKGDRAAIPELWAAWSRPLFAIAMRGLDNAGDAEEVLQDAFVKYWKKAALFDPGRCQPFSWAVMILRGLLLDKLRARRSRPVLVAGTFVEMTAGGESVGHGLRSDLEWALAQLSGDERQALEMAVFQPGTHEELAARLGQPLGTVKARIRKAVEKIRAALTE
jgi:RNA polymerase sigma-70 factor, ECF subfamily